MIRAPVSVVALTRHAAFPLAVLVLAAMVLGLAPILVRLTETGPAAAGFWRFLFALPLLTLLTATQGSGAGRGLGTPSRWMLLAGLFFVLDLAFWHYGIVMTSVANATVLCNLTPVVVTLFAWIVWKQRPGRSFVQALTLAVRVTFWATLVGTPLLLLIATALGEDILPAGPGGWLACAGLGLMHVVGQGGVAWALGRLPASVTAVTILIQPVVAALLGWWIFAEALTPVQAIGGVLVLIGVVLAQRASRLPPPAGPVMVPVEAADGPRN